MKDYTKQGLFLLSICLVLVVIVAVVEINSKNINNTIKTFSNIQTNDNINIASLTYPKLKYFLEEQGYSFETTTTEALNFTYFYNENVSIGATIEIESYKYIISFWDKALEGPACCITDTSANTSKEQHQQYNSYLKWKDNIGLTQEQIKEVLLKYYLENK